MSSYSKIFAIGFAALALSGCASALTSAPPSAIYELSVPASASSIKGSTGSQILITVPKVVSVLDTDHVVIKPSANEVSYFPDVRWADKAPRLVQLNLARTFSNSGGARAVGLPGDGLIIDHQLLFDLRSFQVERSAGGFVGAVELEVRIMNDRNGRILKSKIFRASVPASDDAQIGVAALDKAMSNVSKSVATWVFSRI